MTVSMHGFRALALALVASIASVSVSHALEGSWHVGVGAGISKLSPDTDGSGFTLNEDQSTAAGLNLGLDITRWLSAEVAFTDLGTAELSGDENIDYSAISIGAVAYVYGARDASIRHTALSGYLRLGLSQMENEASILLDKDDNNAVWLGAGIQWPIGQSWGVRGELLSFDGDAQALMASLYWRKAPGGRASLSQKGGAIKPPAPIRNDTVSGSIATKPEKAAPAPVDAPTPAAPKVALAACATEPSAGEPVDRQGCGLFSGVLQGVEFEGDTAILAGFSQQSLDSLAASLSNYPLLVLEIRVHTQTYAAPDRAKQLSKERAVAVARYLVGQGIDVKQLRARAFGSTQPLPENNAESGRDQNNRVDISVL